MSLINGYEFPDDLVFDDHMQYARVEGNIVTIGLSDFAQRAAKEIAFVGLPRAGRKVEQGKPFASVESGKWVGRLYAPVSGEVTAANQALDDDPVLINRAPYGAGWIAKIKAASTEPLSALHRTSDADFGTWLQAQVKKYGV